MSAIRVGTRRRFPRAGVGLAVLLSASLLAACGNSSGSGSGSSGTGGGSADAQAETSIHTVDPYGGDPAKEPKPKSGGTLTIGADRAVISYDPVVGGSNMGALAVYDSLMKPDKDGNPEPYLAKSMKTTDGGTTWVMGLRPGVKFSDGTPLNAQAVIINTQRHIDQVKSRAHTFAMLIDSMSATDDNTVQFKLKAPDALFPVLFAQGFAVGSLGYIMSPAAIQQYGQDIGSHPVGAGPFTLTSWVRDSKMVLTKNPNYWQKGLPYLDTVEVRPIPDTDARYASVENGDVDVDTGAYQPELYKAVRTDKLRVYYGTGNGSELVHFNFTKAPFNDKRMREAFIRGINVDAMAATQFQGDMARAKEWFGDSSPYYSDEAAKAWPTYDPKKAKALVADYVADGGSASVEYSTTNASNRLAFAQFLQAQMKDIGIDLKVQAYDLAQYAGSVVLAGNFQICGNVAGPVDNPYPNLGNLFGSDGNINYGHYSNPKVDALLADTVATSDEAQRKKDYQQIAMLTTQDLAVMYTNRGYLSTITQKNVYGVVRDLTRDMWLATTWVDR